MGPAASAGPTRTTRRLVLPGVLGGYPCCGTARPTSTPVGQHRLLGHRAPGMGGRRRRRHHGQRHLHQPAHPEPPAATKRAASTSWTGNASRGYDRTVTRRPRFGQRSRAPQLQRLHGQRSTGSSGVGHGRRRQHLSTHRRDHAGPEGYAHGRHRLHLQRAHRPDQYLVEPPSLGNNHYADVNGTSNRNTAAAGRNPMPAAGRALRTRSSWADP